MREMSRPWATRVAFGIAWGAIGILAGSSAHAQIVGRSLANAAEADSVNARSKSNYDPAGISIGDFRLYASADAKVTYDTNIYDTDTMRHADVETTIAPRLELSQESERYSLDLTADSSIERFGKLVAENNEQYNIAASGRLNIGRSESLTLNGFYGLHSELRGTLGDVVVGAPDQYRLWGAHAGAEVDLLNLVLTAGGGFQTFSYNPVQLGGTIIPQGYRNRTGYAGTVRAALQVSPGLLVFAQGDYNSQNYSQRVGGVDQDSHGYSVVGGIDFGLTELISGEIAVGYLAQTYAQASLSTEGGVTYSGKIVWNPTTLLTATLTGGRTLEQSPFLDQSGVIEDTVSFNLDYELLRNVIVSASAHGTFDNYRGLGRHDRLLEASLSARYLINRTFEAGLLVDRRDQSSRGPLARPYAGTSVSISLTVKR